MTRVSVAKGSPNLKPPPSWLDWFGFRQIPDLRKARWLGGLLGTLIALVLVVGIGAMVVQFIGAVTGLLPVGTGSTRHEAIRNTGLVLAAIIGAPFVMWRSAVAAKQADISEEGLITERLSAAVENLGAMKKIKTVKNTRKWLLDTSGKWQRDEKGNGILATQPDGTPDQLSQELEITAPNMEVRVGAIYALERIAQDSERDHPQIMDILCTYVRQNSSVDFAKRSPHEVFEDLTAGSIDSRPLHPEDAFQHENYQRVNLYGWNPIELTNETLKEWARKLARIRADVQAAVYVLGRRSERQRTIERDIRRGNSHFRLDLSHCNLQRADFGGLNFSGTLFRGTNFQGSYVGGCSFDGANFREANLHPISFDMSSFKSAYFRYTRADFQQLFDAGLDGSLLRNIDLRDKVFETGKLANIMADLCVQTGAQDRPEHWPTEELDWKDLKSKWDTWRQLEAFDHFVN